MNKIVDSFLESVTEELQQGEEVYMKEFGRFALKVRKARNTFHPQSKEPIHIPEKVSAAFTVSRKFKVEAAASRRFAHKAKLLNRIG